MSLVIERPRLVKGAAHLLLALFALFALLSVYGQYQQQYLAVREGLRAQLEQRSNGGVSRLKAQLGVHRLQAKTAARLHTDSCLSPAAVEEGRERSKLVTRWLSEISQQVHLEPWALHSKEHTAGLLRLSLDGNLLIISSEQYLGRACGNEGDAVVQITESRLVAPTLPYASQFNNAPRVVNMYLGLQDQEPLLFSIRFDKRGIATYGKVPEDESTPTEAETIQAQKGKRLVNERFVFGFSDPELGLKLIYFGKINGNFNSVYFNFNKTELLLLLGLLLCLAAADRLLLHLVDSSLAFHHASTRDFLTGLYNRRAVLDMATAELSRAGRTGRPVSAVLLDIDHFKRINDTYGHDCGDQMLKFFAEQLRQAMRQEDVLARIGGEEFIVLLPETDPEQARIAAERLLQALREAHVEYEGQRIGITCSAGAGTWRGAEESFENLYIRCDELLYQAKQQGRDCCVDETEAALARSVPASAN